MPKLGVLLLMLMLAMGAMGVTYGGWTDTDFINSHIQTGVLDTELTCGDCSPDEGETSIECLAAGVMQLDIYVDNIQDELAYECYFNVDNDTGYGTLPVIIQDITLSPAIPAWASYSLDDVAIGDVIDPGDFITGKLTFELDDPNYASYDIDCTLTVDLGLWNE